MTSAFFPETIDLSASAVQLIQTALANPRVTLDKTGLKSYNASGVLVAELGADGTALDAELSAQGITLPANTGAVVSPTNEILWVEEASGAPVASIAGSTDNSGDGTLTVGANGPTTGSGTLARTPVAEINYQVGTGGPETVSVTAGRVGPGAVNNSATIFDSAGASSFLQLQGNAANVDIAFGSSAIFWSASQTATPVVITHNIGRVPAIVLITAKTQVIGFEYQLSAAAFTTTQFTVDSWASLSNSGGVAFSWLAIG